MGMLTCKEASRLLSESQERTLGRLELWGLRLHLWMCSNCRRFHRQIRFLRKALRSLCLRLESGSQGPDISPEARNRIRQALLAQR